MTEPVKETTARRTRFARLYGDGSLNVSHGAQDLVEARRMLCDSADDDDVELVEVEVRVVRSHGRPKLRVVTQQSATCPCCGEVIWITPEDEMDHAETL